MVQAWEKLEFAELADFARDPRQQRRDGRERKQDGVECAEADIEPAVRPHTRFRTDAQQNVGRRKVRRRA